MTVNVTRTSPVSTNVYVVKKSLKIKFGFTTSVLELDDGYRTVYVALTMTSFRFASLNYNQLG